MKNHRLHRLKEQITQIVLLVTSYSLLVTVFDCNAQPISSSELINNAKQYDGNTVVYQGEVIGDVMARKEYVWLNVNDGNNAIGVWLNKEMAKDILYAGSYKSKGDWVEIKGIFNRACPNHGGDLDIHAQNIKLIRQGSQVKENLDIQKRNFAFLLSGILGLLVILGFLWKKR